jgi:hypothetical protein
VRRQCVGAWQRAQQARSPRAQHCRHCGSMRARRLAAVRLRWSTRTLRHLQRSAARHIPRTHKLWPRSSRSSGARRAAKCIF